MRYEIFQSVWGIYIVDTLENTLIDTQAEYAVAHCQWLNEDYLAGIQEEL